MPTPLDRPPGWVRDAVFYQIFPDRFAKSDRVPKPPNLHEWDAPPQFHGYKGGDLIGVVEHLDHLTELGINAIYFNPIFQSAASHRYHTHDYYLVDPMLGGNDAFDELLAACRDRGIRVVLDGVFNHASRGFLQFNDILENGPESAWLDWFHIYDWPLHPYESDQPANYGAWWNLKALPKFNTDNPEVREYLFGVAEHWTAKGIDGWRLDVPAEIQTAGFWEEFRTRVKAINPDAYLVGEHWGDATWWVNDGSRFDGAMNYQLATAIISFAVGHRVDPATAHPSHEYEIEPPIDAATFADRITWLHGAYAEHATLAHLNVLDTHDTARILSIASGDKRSVELALFLMITHPGAPCLYYGTEVGLDGGLDPDCRKGFPWDPEVWDHELLTVTRELITLRHDHPALRSIDYNRLWPLEGTHGEMVYVYRRRSDDGEQLVAAVNAGDQRETLTAPAEVLDDVSIELLWGNATLETGENNLRVSMPQRSAALWRLRSR